MLKIFQSLRENAAEDLQLENDRNGEKLLPDVNSNSDVNEIVKSSDEAVNDDDFKEVGQLQ